MKNSPKSIFLQIGIKKIGAAELNFDDLDKYEMTWSEERIFQSDIEYTLKQ